MIVDRVEYAAGYAAQFPHLKDALDFISQNPNPGEGRHPFSGGYLMCQEGMTKGLHEGGYEAHRKYVDVQILKEGREIILWDRLENMTETAPYSEEKDKLSLQGSGSILEMLPGMFCILLPSDAHTACRHLDGETPAHYVKYVVKLELS